MNESTVQESHDELTKAVTAFVEQVLQGSHQPTIVQWMQVSEALREAAGHVERGVSATWVRKVSSLITDRVIQQLNQPVQPSAGA